MSISVYCEHCEGTFKVQDKRAGKKVYCKLCNEVVKVPKPSAVEEVPVAEDSDDIVFASSDDIGIGDIDAFADLTPPPQSRVTPPARKKPRRPSDDTDLASNDDMDGIAGMTPLPRTRVTPFTRKKPRKRSSGVSWPLPSSSGVVIAGFVVVSMVAVLFLAAHMNRHVGGTVSWLLLASVMWFFLTGLVLMTVGAIGLMISAFQESAACGLMYMFVPFYYLYYMVSRWEDTRYPKLVVYGFLITIAPPFLIGSLEQAIRGNRRGAAPVRAPQGFGPLGGQQNIPAGQPPGPAQQPLLNDEAFRISRPIGDTVLKAGDSVLSHRGATWWRAHVVSIELDGKIKVHYDGWSDALDEVVFPDNIRIPNP